jgi:endonuclease/exonuclease/phosphatase (EEP) superfamily protein YafD
MAAVATALLIALARFHWTFDLLSHFRLQFAVALLSLAALLTTIRKWKPAAVVGLCLLPQLWALSWHYWPFAKDQRASTGPELKVMSFNVLSSNDHYQRVLDLVAKEDPDLLFLMEIDSKWHRKLASLRKRYPFSGQQLREDNFGVLFFSKVPLIRSTILSDEEIQVPLLMAELTWQGENLTFIGAHPLTPLSKNNARVRNAAFQRIHELSENEETLLVAGDFNCSSYSPHFRALRKGLRDSARGRGNVTTWHRFSPLLAIPIDHIFYSANLVCTSRAIGPGCGSDHSAVLATFRKRFLRISQQGGPSTG